MPVVACSLHSQVPCVAAAILAHAPHAQFSYFMTDGPALPLALSDLVASMVAAGLVGTTITAGHAFEGDLDALSVPSALLLARQDRKRTRLNYSNFCSYRMPTSH